MTAYDMSSSDWISGVCSSDLQCAGRFRMRVHREPLLILAGNAMTRGDILGGLPHRDIGVVKLIRPRLPIEGEARIGREVEAALRHHRHAFDATRDEGIAGDRKSVV